MDAKTKVIDGELWTEFCEALKTAGQDIIDNSAADELERAEGFRYLARITSNMLRSNLDPSPLYPPKIEYGVTRIGANNPDFLYGTCRIRGTITYRISGQVNDAYTFNIGAFHGRLGTAEGLQGSGFLTASEIETDSDGRFEIIASRDQQAGNWLQLVDQSNQLIVRQTVLNPGADQAAEISVEVLTEDTAAEPLQVSSSLTAEQLERRLGMSALMVHGTVKQFIGWTNDFRQRPNEIHPIKPELLGMAKGDPNAQYNYAYFDLQEDEALLVRLQPPTCEYWNIQLANHWMESLDPGERPLSINMANAVAQANGTVSIVVSQADPQVPNWLDTQGHSRGVIALRWVGAEPQERPVTKVVKLADLASEL